MKSEKLTARSKAALIIGNIVCGLIALTAIVLWVICDWYGEVYPDLSFRDLLYTLASPLKGTGVGVTVLIVAACVPKIVVLFAVYLAVAVTVSALRFRCLRAVRRAGALLCAAALLASADFSYAVLKIPEYLEFRKDSTLLYDEYYVDPDTVTLTLNGEKKNLIYIYMESMETTYASKKDGGRQNVYNYMPGLTALAAEEGTVSFSDSDLMGGFHSPTGTTWTMAALLATTSGIPFSFPVGENSMSLRTVFAGGLTTLGDLLEKEGYRQEFLCGSDADFAGRREYFQQHGNYEIYDLDTARKNGDLPTANYHDGWWGFEDVYLYEIAKKEITRLAESDEPFNFTMLTVDTHHVGGNTCELCENERFTSTSLERVVRCADRQVTDFLDWCRTQPFFEDTVIIVTGDHPRMDSLLIRGTPFYDRTIYNCFLNTPAVPEWETKNREFLTMDLFPTILSALGYEIPGDRLGLGTDLFSDTPTLAEQLGYEYVDTELQKYSEYYLINFS